MDKSVFKTLEFDKILEKMAGFTESEAVKKRILALSPFATLTEAKKAQAETSEAVNTCLKLGNPPVNFSVKDITGAVKRSEIGGQLSPADLMYVSRVMYVARRIKSYLSDAGEDARILHGLGDAIVTAKPLEESINTAILSETEIADDASADLAQIRRKMKTLNAKIRESLDNMIRSETYKKYLQDPIVTIRSDRYVLPVKSEYRAEVHGIVHDTSRGGGTLFIEPMSVVNLNNEIRDLLNKEQLEIEKILATLSAQVAENSGIVLSAYDIVCQLDFIFCKAKLSFDMRGKPSRF